MIARIILTNWMNVEFAEIEGKEGINAYVGGNGCLTGDTLISMNRCKLGKKRTIKQMYESFNGLRKNKVENWDKQPTYVRSYFKDKKRIMLTLVKDITYSGKKEVFLIELENGNTLKATKDHKIMTFTGYVEVRHLKIDDSIMCDTPKPIKVEKDYKDKDKDKEIYGIRYHPFAKKEYNGSSRKGNYYRFPIHRLIYEAYLNELSYEDFLIIIKTDKQKAKNLKYLNSKEYEVHHKDGNHYNNDINNLQKVTFSEHRILHDCYNRFNQGTPVFSKVKKISLVGVEDTYDIACVINHNFVANNIIVHNSGKSAVFEAIAFIFLDRKKGGTYKDYIKIGEKSARVQLEWLIGRKSCYFDYEISRVAGSVSRSIQFEGIEKPFTGTEDCQQFLQEHFDLKMLRDIVFNLQDAESITTMAPADRREIMQKVFNVNFEFGLTELKKDSDGIDESYKLVVARKRVLSEKEYDYTQPEPILDEAEYPKYVTDKTSAEVKLAGAGDLSEINTRIIGQNSIILQLQNQITGYSNSITASEQSIQRINDDIGTKTTEISSKTAEKSRIEADILTSKAQKDALTVILPETIKEAEQRLADARSSLSLVQKQLIMNRQGLCDSCGQTCDPKHIAELEQEERNCMENLDNCKITLESLQKDDYARQMVINTISSQEQILKLTEERISGSNQLLQSYISEKTRLETSLTEVKANKIKVDTQKAEADTILSAYLLELETKKKEQEALEPIRQQIRDLDEKIKKIDASRIINIERKRINLLLTEQEENDKKDIEALTVQEQGYLDQFGVFKQTKTILETILPDFIISQACVILEEFINQFIQSTEVDLKAKLVATSSSKKSKGVQFYYLSHTNNKGGLLEQGEWLPVSMASGYEVAILTLAFKLAIAFMYQSDILLLDEPDRTATEDNSLILFKHIANLEGFKQIFLISHREPLVDWIKNDALAHVYRVDQGTFEEVI